MKTSYISQNFKDWFGEIPKPSKKFKYELKTLERSMNDEEILNELKPKPITLEEFAYALTVLDKLEWYIFYIKDNTLVLRAVFVYWFVDGWRVDAREVGFPDAWRGVSQVFSRNFDSQILRPSDTSLESAIEICKKEGYTVIKIM